MEELPRGAALDALGCVLIVRHLEGDIEKLAERYALMSSQESRAAARQLRRFVAGARAARDEWAALQQMRREADGFAGETAKVSHRDGQAESAPVLLSAGQLAAEWKVSVQWVRQLCRDKELRASRSGRAWVIAQADAEEYLDQTRRTA